MAKHVIRISEEEAANDFASLDPAFAADVEEILTHRKPWNPPSWE